MNQPETARALLHRYGLPEDVIDGALCLHAQELAAVQRLRMDELDLTGQKARFIGRIVDLIDPTKTAAVSSAGQAPATDHTALRDRIAAALHQDQTPPPATPWADEAPLDREYFLRRADVVLAVLPAPVDRAAVLREAEAKAREVVARLWDGGTTQTAMDRAGGARAVEFEIGLMASGINEPAPDFFQPGHSYTHRDGSTFRCVAVTTHPDGGERVAIGWHTDTAGWTFVGVRNINHWNHEYDGVEPPAAELRRLADETPDTQTEAACVCGHPVRLHHEDVCQLTGCGCADALEISALPEALEALLTKKFTELGNPFSRMRRQEQGPDGWPAEHPVGPHHVAEALRELLRQAADSGPELRLPDHTVNEAESPDDPLRPAPRNRHRAAWDALTPQQQATYLAQLADDEPAAGARQDGAQR